MLLISRLLHVNVICFSDFHVFSVLLVQKAFLNTLQTYASTPLSPLWIQMNICLHMGKGFLANFPIVKIFNYYYFFIMKQGLPCFLLPHPNYRLIIVIEFLIFFFNPLVRGLYTIKTIKPSISLYNFF